MGVNRHIFQNAIPNYKLMRKLEGVFLELSEAKLP